MCLVRCGQNIKYVGFPIEGHIIYTLTEEEELIMTSQYIPRGQLLDQYHKNRFLVIEKIKNVWMDKKYGNNG